MLRSFHYFFEISDPQFHLIEFDPRDGCRPAVFWFHDIIDATVEYFGHAFQLAGCRLRSTMLDVADLPAADADGAAELGLRQTPRRAKPGNTLPELAAVVEHTMAWHDVTRVAVRARNPLRMIPEYQIPVSQKHDGSVKFMSDAASVPIRDTIDARLSAAVPAMLNALLGIRTIAREMVTQINADMYEHGKTCALRAELARWQAVEDAIVEAVG